MAINAIDNIREKVVRHLLERHFMAKEQGEEFLFMVDTPGQNDAALYFLQEEIGNKNTIRVLLYGKWNRALIAYLLIDETEGTYLVGQFDSQHNFEINIAKKPLRDFFMVTLRNDENILYRHRQSSPESFLVINRIAGWEDLNGRIDFFLKDVKPEIDKRVKPLRALAKYNYFFFDYRQFEAYLATEPYYTSPEKYTKSDLRLISLRVKDFRGIKQAVIEDLPTNVRWIVLTGENGYGKTSVLQAIAAGLYGNYDESGRELVPGNAFIGIEYQSNKTVVTTSSYTSRELFYREKLGRELATYGSARLQVSASVSSDTIEEQLPTTYHLFNSNGLLLNVEQLLKDTHSYKETQPFHNQLISLFKALIPQLAEIRFEVVNLLPEISYVEKDEMGELLNDGLQFHQLAAGFRNIIAMIGDMVYRLSVKQKVENLSELQGIVIIDEIELHLHPTYQKLLPEVLSTQFPNIQFIVSTHSPIPLLGIPAEAGAVLLHVTRSQETGIAIERLDIDFSVLTPNAILTSPIFGFKDLIPDSKPDDQMIRPEDTYEEVEVDRKLRQEINAYLSPKRQAQLLKLIKE